MKSKWDEMGSKSLKVYLEKFQKQMIIEIFIKNIKDE